jgi:hypothetical protein
MRARCVGSEGRLWKQNPNDPVMPVCPVCTVCGPYPRPERRALSQAPVRAGAGASEGAGATLWMVVGVRFVFHSSDSAGSPFSGSDSG